MSAVGCFSPSFASSASALAAFPMSIGLHVSGVLGFELAVHHPLSRMMFSNAVISASYVIVVPLSGINC